MSFVGESKAGLVNVNSGRIAPCKQREVFRIIDGALVLEGANGTYAVLDGVSELEPVGEKPGTYAFAAIR